MPDVTGRRPYAVIVRNPRARRSPTTRRVWEAATPLRRAGWRIELMDTDEPGAATRMAAWAAEAGADVVVACGGDGTVNEVLNGLSGRAAALAVMPGGTANVWAREAHVPRDPVRALALLEGGRRVRVDLGHAAIEGGPARRFLLMCGLGLDAEVVRRVESHPREKRLLRQGAFVLEGSRALASAGPQHVRIEVDGREEERVLLLGVAGNTRLYGGVVRLAGEARIDDGLLDLVTFEAPPDRARYRRYPALLARAVRGRLVSASARGIAYRRGATIRVTPESRLPVQLDGEWFGVASPAAPLELRALPGALEVVVAPGPQVLLGEA